MNNKEHQAVRTSAEVTSLWTSYQGDTLTICGLKHFLNNVDDEQILHN